MLVFSLIAVSSHLLCLLGLPFTVGQVVTSTITNLVYIDFLKTAIWCDWTGELAPSQHKVQCPWLLLGIPEGIKMLALKSHYLLWTDGMAMAYESKVKFAKNVQCQAEQNFIGMRTNVLCRFVDHPSSPSKSIYLSEEHELFQKIEVENGCCRFSEMLIVFGHTFSH